MTYYKPKQTIKTISYEVKYGARVVVLRDNTKAVIPYGSSVIVPMDKFLNTRDFSSQSI
jgi:galactose-1-phosphate uridylyltransferase